MMLIPVAFLFFLPIKDNADFHKWGMETIDRIETDLSIPGRQLFAEKVEPGQSPKHVSFDWAVGVMLSALNGAAVADATYKSKLAAYVEATRAYWNSAAPVPGYDVLPGPKKPDRYYDDNEWMVLSLVDASQILGSRRALSYAEQDYQFVISGQDDQLGGGIFWQEAKRTSKNTCSNAPAAAAALSLFRITRDQAYLTEAENVYAWTREHLRDPKDGLYWDNIDLSGKVNRMKWSYNTGLMLRDAAELYDLTKKGDYANDARELQAASLKHWVNDNGSFKDGGKFMHLLLENWLRAYRLVPGVQDPREIVETGLIYLHDHARDSLGHYGDKWDEDAPQQFSPFNLIDQASVARAFFEAAKLSKAS